MQETVLCGIKNITNCWERALTTSDITGVCEVLTIAMTSNGLVPPSEDYLEELAGCVNYLVELLSRHLGDERFEKNFLPWIGVLATISGAW